jgi:hypothetical protein
MGVSMLDLLYGAGLADEERLALLVTMIAPVLLLLGIAVGNAVGYFVERAAHR